jgi:hypothetical protein
MKGIEDALLRWIERKVMRIIPLKASVRRKMTGRVIAPRRMNR